LFYGKINLVGALLKFQIVFSTTGKNKKMRLDLREFAS